MDDNANPYRSPATESVRQNEADLSIDPSMRPAPWLVIIKWTFVCGVSAAPSFFWGLGISQQRSSEIIGMIAGISLFAVAYTVLECLPRVQQMLGRRFVRRTARIGYITRITISIIFPIGLFLDLWFGVASISITQSIFGANAFDGRYKSITEVGVESDFLYSFCAFFFTTVVQGILLNMLLLGYMLLIYGACWLFASISVEDDQ